MDFMITGSRGFIGRHLVKKIQESHDNVVQWDRKFPVKWRQIQYLVHLAARVHQMNGTHHNPLEEFLKINRDLALQMAESSLEAGIKKFILISSVKVMGERSKSDYVFTEQDSPQPIDPYGISKWEAEKVLIELFSKQSKAQCIILRLPMVYGPGNKGNMLAFLKAASKGIRLPLGSVKNKRSMIYVNNACDAIIKVLKDETPDRPPAQTYFINDNHDLTSGELYSLISQTYNGNKGIFSFPESILRFGGEMGTRIGDLFGKTIPINNEIVSRLFNEYRFSCESFCRDYKWQPPFEPKEGIQETVKWYENRLNL
jgi:nucleoside-diphosphate-sugar epimerase